MKLFYYDVETCGLKPNLHSIHQLSAIIEIDGRVVETLDLKMRPHPKSKIEPMALSTCGVTEEQIRAYPDPVQQFKRLKAVLAKYVDPHNPKDKMFRAGFNNAKFDNEFLVTWFALNNDESHFMYFWPDCIDVMVLASSYLAPIRHTLPSFKLHRVATTLGITLDNTKLHNALYDVELTREIHKRLPCPTIRDVADGLD